MKGQTNRKLSKTKSTEYTDVNLNCGEGKFTFENGDSYEGGYKYDARKGILVKQGSGIYKSQESDTYYGIWEDDTFGTSEFHIRYDNGTEYKGKITASGMSGPGVYKFPDGSFIETTWEKNKPIGNILYKEASGFPWTVEAISENGIVFIASNQSWNELCEFSSGEEK